jgi:hypothetical protein
MPDAESPPASPRTVLNNPIKQLTNRVLSMAFEELRREETQRKVREHLVHPLIKMIHSHLMPYLMMFVMVIAVLLLMSMLTLILSILFYFRRGG